MDNYFIKGQIIKNLSRARALIAKGFAQKGTRGTPFYIEYIYNKKISKRERSRKLVPLCPLSLKWQINQSFESVDGSCLLGIV